MIETRSGDLPPTEVPEQRMQRLRVGITGLAAVLLVVLLATAIASGVRRGAVNETAVTSSPTAPSGGPTENGADLNAEPLAQLGAAPGGASDNPAADKGQPR